MNSIKIILISILSVFILYLASNIFEHLQSADKILIVGTGGAGNTEFVTAMKKAGITDQSPGNKDGLKHLSSPTNVPKKYSKAIFLYANNLSRSIYSHYRRNKPGEKFNWTKAHFNNFGKTVPQKFEDLVAETGKQGTDITGIIAQIDRWQHAKIPVLFVDFETINDATTQKAIKDFIGSNDVSLPKLDKARLAKHDVEYEKITRGSFFERYYRKEGAKCKSLNCQIYP